MKDKVDKIFQNIMVLKCYLNDAELIIYHKSLSSPPITSWMCFDNLPLKTFSYCSDVPLSFYLLIKLV